MMSINTSNINILWGSLIVEELIRNRVDYFCISPGSRSTPLTAAVDENSHAKHILCFDERGAAFHAMGYGKATGNPAVLICTSGTAAANYFPAVIEASANQIPMIILTADRPPELRETGANQTIDQAKLYGKYVNWEFDMPCPDEKIPPEMVLTTIDQAVFRSRRSPCGPVHINCMFREPLAPVDEPIPSDYMNSISTWKDRSGPMTTYEFTVQIPKPSSIKEIASIIDETRQGFILVGKLTSKPQAESILQLAKKLNWPVFPDVNSRLRFQVSKTNIIAYHDQMLIADKLWEKFAPQTILQFGGRSVSKRLMEYIEQVRPKNRIQILDHPSRHDPKHIVSHRIEAEIVAFSQSLLLEVSAKPKTPFLSSLIETSNVIDSLLEAYVRPEQAVSEVSATRIVSQIIPEKSALFLASSMPVRDMDMFASTNGSMIPVASNRGASGIDGTLASASGFAVGNNLPLTLVIGDLAMIHDLNSLSILRSIKQPLIIIIINNNGGGIFSFLPIAEFDNIFEKYFGTPHELTFEKAADMFGLEYYHPGTNQEFREIYQEAVMSGKSTVIEIQTDRKENIALHKKIEDRIRISLQS